VEVEELPSAITTRDQLRITESATFGLLLGDSRDGSFVRRVEDNSPASEAGIEEGDIVRKVNRRVVHTAAEATRELQLSQVGRPTFVIVWRGGRETLVEMQRD
jgi:S1-C subfamily serine protease